MSEEDKKREKFEDTFRNLKLETIIMEEVREVRKEKDSHQKEFYKSALESLPDANETKNLERIAGKLGLHHNEGEANLE